jgi:hypothetical protein
MYLVSIYVITLGNLFLLYGTASGLRIRWVVQFYSLPGTVPVPVPSLMRVSENQQYFSRFEGRFCSILKNEESIQD